jgi:tetrapyrrole methylase family protein/MazG family protein
MDTQPQHPDSYQGLRDIISRLRAPDGCPWDQEQTHTTLRRNLLEECYEALEALDAGDPESLSEELGDVLMQIVFHCQIAEENGDFTDADMFKHINEKLVRRHPHVFGDVVVKDAREVEANWEEIKKKERGEKVSVLDGVAKAMSALGYSQSITFRASQAGFEWDDISGVLDKVREEIGELEEAQTKAEKEHEFGDILLSLVNVARWMDIDAESALRGANDRFYGRFTHIEAGARAQGRSVKDMSMEEKDALWEEAKRAETH